MGLQRADEHPEERVGIESMSFAEQVLLLDPQSNGVQQRTQFRFECEKVPNEIRIGHGETEQGESEDHSFVAVTTY